MKRDPNSVSFLNYKYSVKLFLERIDIKILLAGLFCFIFSSCAKTEKTEAITAEITAAQIEGRKAAREIITKDWNDSISLRNKLLEIKAKQSEYIIQGKKESAQAFDSAFISTVRTIRPDIAKKLGKSRN